MPVYSNRVTEESLIPKAVFNDDSVEIATDFGEFILPSNVLTQKIYESLDFTYTLEFDVRSAVLCGVFSPEGATLYRIDDNEVRRVSNSAQHLSRIIKNGKTVPLDSALEKMMSALKPQFLERLKSLPQEYLNEYYVYEVKISYLASTQDEDLIFDPTPSEKAHALALSLIESDDFPPLVQKTY